MRCTIAVIAIGVLGLTGCVESTALTQTTGQGYTSVGPVTEIDLSSRGEAVAFSGLTEDGAQLNSEDWAGEVSVVNFWYAGCAPCRAEAPDLQALNTQYKPDDVAFVGVNVRDQASTAQAFAERFGITYPSILDANTGAVQLAFAGDIAPNAVPTTLVLDREGRVAARIIGQLDRSTLDTLIRDALAK